jgi:hypothetical protein
VKAWPARHTMEACLMTACSVLQSALISSLWSAHLPSRQFMWPSSGKLRGAYIWYQPTNIARTLTSLVGQSVLSHYILPLGMREAAVPVSLTPRVRILLFCFVLVLLFNVNRYVYTYIL